MLRLLLSEPPDEDAFQSNQTTQLLKLVCGNVHHHWAESKLFFPPDETSHYWKDIT